MLQGAILVNHTLVIQFQKQLQMKNCFWFSTESFGGWLSKKQFSK